MKSLIKSLVVAVVGAVAFCVPNLAEAGPTYAQRQVQQRRVETQRANVKMENRFIAERKNLDDQMKEAFRRQQQQTVPMPAPIRQDPYQPGTSQPTTPTNELPGDAQYKASLHQTLATYSQLLQVLQANPGATPEEQAEIDLTIQTVLQSRANILRSLQNLESQGR